MRTTRWTLALLLVLVASRATAQETFSNQEARARFEEGTKLADGSDYERARVKFLQAYALEQRPSILTNLAVCEVKTNRPLEAIEHAEQYLAHPQAEARRAATMKQLLEQLSRSTGRVHVVGPAGLALSVDGASRGRTPAPDVHVMPGKHTVIVGETTRELTCAAGETQTVDVTPSTPPPPPATTTYASGRIPVVVALGGLGVVGVVAGIGFGVASSAASDDALKAQNSHVCVDRASAGCADLRSKMSNATTFATVGLVSYVAAGVFVAGAVGAFLFWPKTHSEPARGVRVQPTLGGLLVEGSF